MKPEKVFKRYDIRGDYPGEINEQFAERLGKALGTFVKRNYSGDVVVCRDNKDSSADLKPALIDGLESTGINVLDAGIGPTDYAAFTGEKHGAVSVQVTSSHLSLDTNGFKFMYPEGNGFLNPDLYEVQDLFRDQDFETGDGSSEDISDGSEEAYRSEIKQFFRNFYGSIDKKAVVDTLGGAATRFLPGLMEELGAEVVNVADEKPENGPYVDPPNPKPEKLGYLEDRVEEEDADLAVANDMDADRVALYFDGEWVSGDDIFAALAQLVDGGRNLVGSIDTSNAVEELVEQKGGEVFYTRIGDPFVIDEALNCEAQLAGEPNGHYCFPGFVAYNSGTLAALLLAAMDLEQALENVPNYYTSRTNVEVEDNNVKERRMEQVVSRVEDSYNVLSDLDGIKFELDEASVLIRPSGSSPVIRVIAESESESGAESAAERAADIIRNP